MSVNNIQANIQNAEQYKIRKQTETKQAEELQSQIQQAEQAAQEIRQLDEYDKAHPVGEEVEGIYSVSHDEAGNLKVNYKQPVSKTEDSSEEKETMQVRADEKADAPKSAGAAPAAGKSEENSESESDDDDDEEEIEKLKAQRDAIKQQLNRAADEETKAALRAQLQSIEMQIALKSSSND